MAVSGLNSPGMVSHLLSFRMASDTWLYVTHKVSHTQAVTGSDTRQQATNGMIKQKQL